MHEFGEKARFRVENYGDSELAERFGVTRYPAIFVDEILVATPKDFGFFGAGEGAESGRYAPLRTPESHARFRADLAAMIELLLAGESTVARARGVSAHPREIAVLPALSLRDLDGRSVTRESLIGRPILIEFWATWCPPCRGTLRWLGDLQREHGDELTVVAIAIESDEARVRSLVGDLGLPITWVLGTPDVARAFGDISAVPTLFLFDAGGRTDGVYYGAPPTLHDRVEARVAELTEDG